MDMIENLIIGAGPAGLAIAGRMTKGNLPFTIIDKESNVGSAWHRHYDRLHLHTVKEFSHLPHLPFPDDYPRYVPKQKLIAYFEQYISHFKINPLFKKEVKSISKNTDKSWRILFKNGEHENAKNLIIATGVNRVPHQPTWKGIEKFEGSVYHSIHYKNPKKYIGRSVLVVGFGNTGAEIALDLSEHNVETAISIRGKVSVVPRDLNGRPVQITSKMLAKLPFGFGDWIGSKVRNIYFGDLSKYGLIQSTEYPAVQLRKTGKTPTIDIGTIDAIKEGKIKVVGDIEKFDANNVHFKDGKKIKIDDVILATGYKAHLEQFIPKTEKIVDQYGFPISPIGTAWHEGLYFVGFDNYKLGGLLGTIYTDSEKIVNHINSKTDH